MIGAGYGDIDRLASQARVVAGSRFGIGVITWSMGERTLDTVLGVGGAGVVLGTGIDKIERVHPATNRPKARFRLVT